MSDLAFLLLSRPHPVPTIPEPSNHPTGEKRCSECKKLKPQTEYRLYYHSPTTRPMCRECENFYNKVRRRYRE